MSNDARVVQNLLEEITLLLDLQPIPQDRTRISGTDNWAKIP